MNPVVEAQVNDFVKINGLEEFGGSDRFEIYSIYSILNGIFHENMNPLDAHLKGSEFGVDAACILASGEVASDEDSAEAIMGGIGDGQVDFIFIQSKRSQAFDYGEISKLFDAVHGFFDGSMAGESNEIDDLISAKKVVYGKSLKKNPNIRCVFNSTGKYEKPKRIENLVKNTKDKLNDLNIFDKIDIRIIGARELQDGYRAATSSNSSQIEFPDQKTMPAHPSVEQAYLGYIAGDELLKIALNDDDSPSINPSIFFDNVRDFNPKSEINKSIVEQIESGDRSAFVFRNNGITVVAKNINRTGDKFLIEDFQIVNGCQTTNIISICSEYANELKVPMRLIGSSDNEFITSIIVGTNSQNTIKDEQFWALKPFMKNLEDYFRQQSEGKRLYLERRENQYRSENIERTRLVKPSLLLKAVAAMYLYQPHRSARDFRAIRREFEDSILKDAHSVVLYHACCFADYRFEFLIRNGKIPRDHKIFKFYILFSIGYASSKKTDVFSLSQKKQVQVGEKIIKLCADESAFTRFCNDRASKLEELVTSRTGSSAGDRERLRDAIRSEAYFKSFKSELEENLPPID